MSELPTLTESAIRESFTEKTWVRGLEYYGDNSVYDIVWRGGALYADVMGRGYEAYHVHAEFMGDVIVDTSCTCPYDWDGDCKHIAALLLCLVHGADEITERPAIDELIAHLNRDQLASLVLELADRHPALIEEIERIAPAATDSEAETVETANAPLASALPPVDFDLLRRQITADMRDSIEPGYDSWGEEAWYHSDLSVALTPALTRVRAFLDTGDAEYALNVLAETTYAWSDGADELDDYLREYFEESGADLTSALGEYWAEAILSADLSPDERREWTATLGAMVEDIFGGDGLQIALTAAEDGWDAPALVAAMNGNITEQGAWVGDIPWYASELAEIRLDILEKRGQFQEYLNLSQAEGELMRYMQMLVKQGQVESAVEESHQLVTTPAEAHTLAETLLEHGEVEQAFTLARRGLNLEGEEPYFQGRNKAPLAAWLRDEAHNHHQPKLALSAGQRALAEAVTLTNYLALQTVAGDQWPRMKTEMLALVTKKGETDGQVDIFLHEQMYDKAIAVVDKAQWFYEIDKVIEAVKVDYPDWGFRQCCQRAESIMNAGRAKEYDVAASWLRRGRDILLAAGKRGKWDAYLEDVMDKHHRKYKLMPMLRALQ